jgi:RNA polymerase sigma-70 factor (ECF subfamily)
MGGAALRHSLSQSRRNYGWQPDLREQVGIIQVMRELRSNQEWIEALESGGELQEVALQDLYGILLRAASFTFQRNLGDLAHYNPEEIERLAEDCAQEALLAILNHLKEFRGSSKFTTWAYKFAVNISLTMARRERWRGVSLDALADQPFQELQVLKVDAAGFDPENAAMRAEIAQIISDAIHNELTERQRLVLKLMVFDEVPMDVVTEYLDTNRNAVYKLLHDTRRKLKLSLEAHGVEINDSIDLFT